jgi:hypothetical protein
MPLISNFSRTAVIAVMLALTACASFTPGSLDRIPVRERAQTSEQDGLRVSVAVLNRDEAQQLFGANLGKHGVQPVWIEVENRTDKMFWLMMHGLDPNYFAANEVAYMNHKRFGGKANKEMDAFFSGLKIDQEVPPGEVSSGFAFSNEAIGTKEVRVRMYSNQDVRDFEYFVTVPGVVPKWESKDLHKLYTEAELVHVSTQQELQAALVALPCCLQNATSGNSEGQPVNVVIIGGTETLRALIRSGWDETVFLQDLRSAFGAVYLYGRPPDLQFAKQRRRVNSTVSLQLWVSPLRYNGKAVVVGSVKRSSDPSTDEAGLFLFEDLATAGSVERAALVGGIPPVSKSAPRRTYGNEAYWTAGQRIVMKTTDEFVPLDQMEFFDWDWKGRRISKPDASPQSGLDPAK